MKRTIVNEINYRDIEDQFSLKLDHLFRTKNKVDLENHILKKEIAKLQDENLKEVMPNPKIQFTLPDIQKPFNATVQQTGSYDLKG